MFEVKKRTSISCYWLVGTLFLSLLFAPNILFSQEEEFNEDFMLEEVTVTASRRTQEIQDVANSITAIEMDTIKQTRIRSLQDIMELVPNAVLEPSSVGDNQVVNIRGVRQAPARISEPAFGLYRNGAYFGGARTNIGTMIDLDRVEILRGPQGGLYGRNAVAGTVNLVYAMPTDRLEGNISALYGSFDRTEFEGMLNVPVVQDKFALRAVGWHHNQDEGEFYNAYLNEWIDQKEDTGGRLSAKWDITPKFEIIWSAEMQETEGPEVMAYFKDFGETKKTIMRDTPSLVETEFKYLSQDINWDTQMGIFQLSATYREYELDGIGDQDFLAPTSNPPSPLPPLPFLPPPANLIGIPQLEINRFDDIEDTFIEGRWISKPDQPITWVAGITYFDEDLISDQRIDVKSLIPDPVFGGLATGTINFDALIKTESFSAWAEATWAITDKFDLIASLRYSKDDKELDFASFNMSDSFIGSSGIPGLPPIIPFIFIIDDAIKPVGTATSSDTFEQWLPGFGARYEFNSNLSVYARINTGFRAGGFNTTTTVAQFLPYDEETSINYEIGMKSVLFNRARVNLSAFRLDQEDLLFLRNDPNFAAFTYLENVGESETYGLEIEVDAMLTEAWTLSAAFGWLDGEITKGDIFGRDIDGENIPGAPDYTFALASAYTLPLTDTLELTLRGSLRQRFGGDQSFESEEELEEYSLVDFFLIVTSEHWQLTGFVENALDDDYIATFLLPQPPAPSRADHVTQGQTFGVKLSYRF